MDTPLRSQLLPLLKPSIVGAYASGFWLVTLIFGFVLSSFTDRGYVRQALSLLNVSPTVANTYGEMAMKLNSSELVGNIVIFLLWSAVGLILFNIVWVLWRSEQNVMELIRLSTSGSLGARQAFEERSVQTTVRVVALIALILLITAFITYILPFVIVACDTSLLSNVFEYCAAIIAVWLTTISFAHLAVILLRCILLRYRIFSDYAS